MLATQPMMPPTISQTMKPIMCALLLGVLPEIRALHAGQGQHGGASVMGASGK
jgi:hypothetical protein